MGQIPATNLSGEPTESRTHEFEENRKTGASETEICNEYRPANSMLTAVHRNVVDGFGFSDIFRLYIPGLVDVTAVGFNGARGISEGRG